MRYKNDQFDLVSAVDVVAVNRRDPMKPTVSFTNTPKTMRQVTLVLLNKGKQERIYNKSRTYGKYEVGLPLHLEPDFAALIDKPVSSYLATPLRKSDLGSGKTFWDVAPRCDLGDGHSIRRSV